jgi:hypothetical protein
MTTQYNIPIKVVDGNQNWKIQHTLQGYKPMTDRSGNLKNTCFSKEEVPYVGEVIVVKTSKLRKALDISKLLKTIEGLIVLPVTESELEKKTN